MTDDRLAEVRRGKVFHLLTCEYPPKPGGVSDYTAVVAAGLVAAGCEVHVWAPGDEPRPEADPAGATVHRVAGRFGPRGLTRLSRGLDRFPGPRTIVVQYVPHGFRWKAMNVPFAAWVFARRVRNRDDVRVMFHEVAYPWVRRSLRYNVIAAVTRIMVFLMIRACSRAYQSIPGWEAMLRQYGGPRLSITWTPVPANIPNDPTPAAVLARRFEVTNGRPAACVIGHFGTYGPLITPTLAPVLGAILDGRPDACVLLLGAGGDRWRNELIRGRTDRASRVFAPGSLSGEAVAEYLRACDLAVQPYPDGASTRRGSLMAALANGVPVVTTLGPLTDPVTAAGPIAFARPDRLADAALGLLDAPERLRQLGRDSRRFYDDHFAVCRTVAALLADSRPTHPGVPSCERLAGC